MRTAALVVVAFLVYSLEGVFAKLASAHEFLSAGYIGYFCAIIAVLGMYAVLWQNVLERVPLGRAFPCKSMAIVFTLAFSHFLFGEPITPANIAGTLLIISGLVVLTYRKSIPE